MSERTELADKGNAEDAKADARKIPKNPRLRKAQKILKTQNTQTTQQKSGQTRKTVKAETVEKVEEVEKVESAVGKGDAASSASSSPRHACSPETLAVCVAEVTNTPWGERVVFNFRPAGSAAAPCRSSMLP